MKFGFYYLGLLSLARPKHKNGISIGLILSTMMLSVGISILVIVMSIFDGYRDTLEDILLTLTPHIQIRKNITTGGIGLFSDDELDETIKFRQGTSSDNSVETDYIPEWNWYMKDGGGDDVEYKENNTFTEKDFVKIRNILNVIPEIELYEPIFVGSKTLDITDCKSPLEKKKIQTLIFSAPFTGQGTSSAIGNILKKNVFKEFQKKDRNDLVILSNRLMDLVSSECILIHLNKGNNLKLKVLSTFQIGLDGAGTNALILKNPKSEILFNFNSKDFISIGVRVKDKYNSTNVKNIITESLPEGFSAIDWTSISPNTFDILITFKFITKFIICMIIIVAAFSLRSSLLVIVHEKMPQISLYRSLGLRSSDIILLFCILGLIVGVIGSTTGIAIGIIAGKKLQNIQLENINSFIGMSEYSIELDLITLSNYMFSSIIICIIFSISPAIKAVKHSMVEGIKK